MSISSMRFEEHEELSNREGATDQIGRPPCQEPRFEVSWSTVDQRGNPRRWSLAYKAFTLLTISWTTLIMVVAATAYTSGIAQMKEELNATSDLVVSLGLTAYLFGWAVGTLILAPVSEMYGRRWVYIISTAAFIVLIIPSGFANDLPGIIVARFLAATAGSGVIALSPGTISDIAYDEQRALAYSIWSIGPFIAPAVGPIFGGFTVEYLGWRWIVWISVAGSGIGLLALCCVRESYAPVLLRRKAKALRAETGTEQWWSRYEGDHSLRKTLRTNLGRPFKLAFSELMLFVWNLYIGLVYGILYLSFTAYPIVFEGHRGWSVSLTGLSFIGLGVGSFICIASEPLIRRFIRYVQKKRKNSDFGPEATVSVVCIAAIMLPISEFWFAWTSTPPLHWIWPILAGVVFGAGATANFIYSLNYLANSYENYAASVMAGNTVWRCVLGGTLPLAGPVMFERLGPHWAGSLLALLLTVMAPVPFLFYKYGARIRASSPWSMVSRVDEAGAELSFT